MRISGTMFGQTVLFYVLLAGTVGVLTYIGTSMPGKRGRTFIVLATSVLVLVKGTAIGTTDIEAGYRLNYEYLRLWGIDRDPSIEPGFRLLVRLCVSLGLDYHYFLLVVGFLTVVPVIWVSVALQRIVEPGVVVASWTLIYMATGMSMIRQLLATSVVMVVVYWCLRGRLLPQFGWLAVAVSIHRSAIVAALLIVLIQLRHRFWCQVAVVLIFLGSASHITEIYPEVFTGRYAGYAGDTGSSVGAALFAKISVPLLVYLAYQRSCKTGADIGPVAAVGLPVAWRSLLLYSFSVYMLGYIVAIFGRAESYTVVLCLLYGSIARVYADARRRSAAVMFVMLYSLGRCWWYISEYGVLDGLFPYRSWLMN